MSSNNNAIDMILHDHNQVKQMYEQCRSLRDMKEKKMLAHHLLKELLIHDEVEQAMLYPLLREKIGGSQAESLYQRSLNEHQEARNLLFEVKQCIENDAPDMDEKMATAMNAMMEHMGEEESEVLPLIKNSIGDEELCMIGDAIRDHKASFPKRPNTGILSQGYPEELPKVTIAPFNMATDLSG